MKVEPSSLGISVGLDRGSFVFGEKNGAVGITFNLAVNLHREDSVAQQYLDFVQKLHSEQSYLGEYFSEIHLSPFMPQRSADLELRSQQSVDTLKQLLAKWMAQESLSLDLYSHGSVEIIAQKKYLSLGQIAAIHPLSDTESMSDAYALWSSAYSNSSHFSQIGMLKIYEAVNYEEISAEVLGRYLSRYKVDTIVSFGTTSFVNDDIERQKQYLLSLAEKSQTTKYDLMVCRERLLELLEKYSLEKAVAPAGSTITGRIVQSTLNVMAEQNPKRPVLDVLLSDDFESSDQRTLGENSQSAENEAKAFSRQKEIDVERVGYFKSPDFAVAEHKVVQSPDGKIWKEATATPMRIDAWLFRIVVLLVMVGIYFLYPYVFK